VNGSTVLYFLHDQQGSTRFLTDSTGGIVASYIYDPYGRPEQATGSATTPLGYDGEYTDAETGFVYMIHRYYDPVTSQFLSVDPLTDETSIPYAFTGGDPVNESDPSGESFLGALVDSFNPISHNNVFYRFGSHHPVAGRALAIGTGVAAGGVAIGAACLAFCLPAAAAIGLGGGEAAETQPGLLSKIGEQCQAFFGDETGAVGGYGKSEVPSWVFNEGYAAGPDETPVQAATRIMNQQYGEGNWSKGPGSEFNQIVKWVSRTKG